MPSPSLDPIEEAFASSTRRQLGLDAMPDEQAFGVVHAILTCLDTTQLTSLANRLAASPKLHDRVKASQVKVVLFAQQELRRLLQDHPTADKMQMIREITEEIYGKQTPYPPHD